MNQRPPQRPDRYSADKNRRDDRRPPRPPRPVERPWRPPWPDWLAQMAAELKSADKATLAFQPAQQQGINNFLRDLFRTPPLLRDMLRRNGFAPAVVDRIVEQHHNRFIVLVVVNLAQWAVTPRSQEEGMPLLLIEHQVLGHPSPTLEALLADESFDTAPLRDYRERALRFLRLSDTRAAVERLITAAGHAVAVEPPEQDRPLGATS